MGRMEPWDRMRRRVRRAVASLPGLALILALAAPLARAQVPVPFPPDYAAVRADWRPSDARLLASDGRELQRLRTDFSSRRGD